MSHVLVGAASLCLLLPTAPLSPQRALVASRRAVAIVACQYENDGDMDDYEDAMRRYKALGMLTGMGEDDDEDDEDDVTPEQMVAWSKQRVDAAAAGTRTTSSVMSSNSAAKETPEGLKAVSSTSAGAAKEFTVETVDQVLDEVRPYLISDGGNVAVVSVDEATMGVTLTLEGACGTCPSSTVTMKMGIERVLRENWPNLGAVMQTDPAEGAAAEAAEAQLTVDVVEEALSPIMPAIAGLGGKIAVLSAEGGTVRLEYSGPEKTKMGIQLSLRDHPLIDQIVFV